MTASPLHPLLAHHVLNSLGWPALRPLQKAALDPIRRGEHALLVAPTAGGKTEAAVFPLLSRMLHEEWGGLSVLYLCPLRALLNNLYPRVEQYAGFAGRRSALWHGDVGDSARAAIRDDPPDCLLTTPESIEAMLISRRTDHRRMFRDVRAVVVDEVHAFGGDDRGWHLRAVVERVQRLAGRPLQRIGLSATVGNAQQLLDWLVGSTAGGRHVIRPPETVPTSPEVTVDHVGNLGNAAVVISRLHRGEKRLVFVDSRARAEELAALLRERQVTTYVSHGSLGREERLRAEQAFADSRDCAIVATSTLELGIDVGDLDRVIQIDAPRTVASFLQRLGRTGRREGVRSNTLFLTTKDDAFLQALGLLRAWEDGYVEPVTAPPLPLHLGAQQLLALVLQEGGVGRRTWTEWLGRPSILGADVEEELPALTEGLLERRFLFEDNGILGIGDEGRRVYGGRNFLDLMAVFSDPPMLTVMAGRSELGQVPVRMLTVQQPGGNVLLLAGRSWDVVGVDWRRGIVDVEPASERGKARWFNDPQALSFAISQGIRRIVAGKDLGLVQLSRRAIDRLARVKEELWWVDDTTTTYVVRNGDRRLWWTFAGGDANLWLAAALGQLRDQVVPGDLYIRLADDATSRDIQKLLGELDVATLHLADKVAAGAVQRLKFAEALPEDTARRVVECRLRDDASVEAVGSSPVRDVASSPGGR